MPELPEVETIARQLRINFLNQRIVRAEAKPCIIFQNISAEKFADSLKHKTLQGIGRYGKTLYWKLEDIYPVFHLGMSGIFLRDFSLSEYPEHIHLSISFENDQMLFFQDVRKFGKINIYNQFPDFSHLGIDPFNRNFTLNKFKKLLNLKKMNIKSFMMDLSIIAGIGNIYANEILYDAAINPLRTTDRLHEHEIENLFNSIKAILLAAINRFGTSYSVYRTVNGINGGNQNFLKVYQRAGQSCVKCKAPIVKIMQNSRSTFYCSFCQVQL